MTHNPSEAGIPPGQAVFLPAFQLPVCSNISNPDARAMLPSSKDLNWYRPDNESWSYCAGLYSLGQSTLSLDADEERMITQRDRTRTLLIADSGGYQLGKGTFKRAPNITKRFLRENQYNVVRIDVLRWMEKHADYGLIIDFPVWAIGKPKYIFSEFDDCLKETIRNMEFFRDNLTGNSQLKLLSVIQGRSIYEALEWYRRVCNIDNFPYKGWSFAGPVASDPTITLRMILTLLRDGRLSEQESWLHFLGQGSLNAVFVYNIFQECLDEFIGKNIRISYDISSPFKLASVGKIYTHMEPAKSGYSMQEIKHSKNITSFKKVYRKKWCVWEGPFDADINYPDLHVEGTKHGLDTKSYAILGHRNVNIFNQAVNSTVLHTKSLREQGGQGIFADIQVRFRNDVRRVFERFVSGGLSETEITYLDLSYDYPNLISSK